MSESELELETEPRNAAELINLEKNERTGILDLYMCGLIIIPEEVRAMDWLTTLSISNHERWDTGDEGWKIIDPQLKHELDSNIITKLPSWIAELRGLETLNLNGSNIVDISALSEVKYLQNFFCNNSQVVDLSSLSGLTQMQTLNCSSTNVSDLSPLSELTKMQTLSCNETSVSDLSPLSGLSKMQTLSCNETSVSDLSPLSGLTKMHNLSCSRTSVSDLSPLSELTQIQILYCGSTRVSDLGPLSRMTQLVLLKCDSTHVRDLGPLSVMAQLFFFDCSLTQVEDLVPLSGLTQLRFLTFDSTSVSDLSPLKSVITQLVTLDVANCPLIIPPAEFSTQGLGGVAEYFDQLGETNSPLNEIKVIFLGEGAAGKTSLIKRITEHDFDVNESQTHGINIRVAPFAIEGDTISARIWDFGGQEVMHATHQFFLSRRCVYVLVLNSRTDDKAEYWLKHASSFGGDSPVLVVLNKVDENPSFDVNRKQLSDKYPQIKAFTRVSCADGTGVDEFQEALHNQMRLSDTTRTPFPPAWSEVKQKLNDIKDNYIDSSDYTAICKSAGLDKEFSQSVLLRFLHDLGVIVNFRNLKNFDTQILNPEWLTNGVYRIINSKIVAANQGLLNEKDFNRVINDERYRGDTGDDFITYPVHKLHYIIRVMQEFELCFQLDVHNYIVPQLLSIEEPDFQMFGPAIQFVVKFPEFMPDSIFPRLMVKLHDYIDGDLRWRTGMVLFKPTVFDAHARVRTDREDSQIDLLVCGQEARRFLSFIRQTIKEIVNDFAKLKYDELIQIPESKVFKSYSDVTSHEEAGENEMFISELKRKVSVSEILDGVEDSSMRDKLAQTPVKAFISYSHKDSDGLGQLRAALSPLERLNKLDIWDDRAIDAGVDWDKEIFSELENADIIICLISADFVNSDFCYDKELGVALKEHEIGKKVVIPIRYRSCDWSELPISRLQSPGDGWIYSKEDKDIEWTKFSKSLRPVLDKVKQRKFNSREDLMKKGDLSSLRV
jgi:internalin A